MKALVLASLVLGAQAWCESLVNGADKVGCPGSQYCDKIGINECKNKIADGVRAAADSTCFGSICCASGHRTSCGYCGTKEPAEGQCDSGLGKSSCAAGHSCQTRLPPSPLPSPFPSPLPSPLPSPDGPSLPNSWNCHGRCEADLTTTFAGRLYSSDVAEPSTGGAFDSADALLLTVVGAVMAVGLFVTIRRTRGTSLSSNEEAVVEEGAIPLYEVSE